MCKDTANLDNTSIKIMCNKILTREIFMIENSTKGSKFPLIKMLKIPLDNFSTIEKFYYELTIYLK